MQTVADYPIGDLTPYERNPRKNDQAVDRFASAITEFGFRVPILAKKDGTVIDGHLRLKAAIKLGMATVPVLFIDDMTPTQIKAFRININKMSELAGWDFDILAAEIDALNDEGFDLDLLGFSQEELNEMIGTPNEAPNDNDADAIPQAVAAITKLGDVWILGNHRLMCGDSTSITTAETVLDGAIPELCIYDPPYDMDDAWSHSYPAERIAALHDFKNVIGAVHALQGKPTVYQFIWDCGSCWWTPNRPLARHKACLIGMDDPMWKVDDATYVDGKIRKSKTVSNTRGECDYEPLPGGAVRMSTVFMRPTTQEDGGHVHSKPVDWIRAMIAGTGAKSVLDQFAGSGTGIIACEQLGIPCYSVELSESTCDIIVKRWENYTGKTAELQK